MIDYVAEQQGRLMETPEQYIEYLRRANRQKLRWLDEMQESIIRQVMDAQADLQTALGTHRLVRTRGYEDKPNHIENEMAKALARLHLLLYRLGNPMYHPATHPEVNGGEFATPIP